MGKVSVEKHLLVLTDQAAKEDVSSNPHKSTHHDLSLHWFKKVQERYDKKLKPLDEFVDDSKKIILTRSKSMGSAFVPSFLARNPSLDVSFISQDPIPITHLRLGAEGKTHDLDNATETLKDKLKVVESKLRMLSMAQAELRKKIPESEMREAESDDFKNKLSLAASTLKGTPSWVSSEGNKEYALDAYNDIRQAVSLYQDHIRDVRQKVGEYEKQLRGLDEQYTALMRDKINLEIDNLVLMAKAGQPGVQERLETLPLWLANLPAEWIPQRMRVAVADVRQSLVAKSPDSLLLGALAKKDSTTAIDQAAWLYEHNNPQLKSVREFDESVRKLGNIHDDINYLAILKSVPGQKPENIAALSKLSREQLQELYAISLSQYGNVQPNYELIVKKYPQLQSAAQTVIKQFIEKGYYCVFLGGYPNAQQLNDPKYWAFVCFENDNDFWTVSRLNNWLVKNGETEGSTYVSMVLDYSSITLFETDDVKKLLGTQEPEAELMNNVLTQVWPMEELRKAAQELCGWQEILGAITGALQNPQTYKTSLGIEGLRHAIRCLESVSRDAIQTVREFFREHAEEVAKLESLFIPAVGGSKAEQTLAYTRNMILGLRAILGDGTHKQSGSLAQLKIYADEAMPDDFWKFSQSFLVPTLLSVATSCVLMRMAGVGLARLGVWLTGGEDLLLASGSAELFLTTQALSGFVQTATQEVVRYEYDEKLNKSTHCAGSIYKWVHGEKSLLEALDDFSESWLEASVASAGTSIGGKAWGGVAGILQESKQPLLKALGKASDVFARIFDDVDDQLGELSSKFYKKPLIDSVGKEMWEESGSYFMQVNIDPLMPDWLPVSASTLYDMAAGGHSSKAFDSQIQVIRSEPIIASNIFSDLQAIDFETAAYLQWAKDNKVVVRYVEGTQVVFNLASQEILIGNNSPEAQTPALLVSTLVHEIRHRQVQEALSKQETPATMTREEFIALNLESEREAFEAQLLAAGRLQRIGKHPGLVLSGQKPDGSILAIDAETFLSSYENNPAAARKQLSTWINEAAVKLAGIIQTYPRYYGNMFDETSHDLGGIDKLNQPMAIKAASNTRFFYVWNDTSLEEKVFEELNRASAFVWANKNGQWKERVFLGIIDESTISKSELWMTIRILDEKLSFTYTEDGISKALLDLINRFIIEAESKIIHDNFTSEEKPNDNIKYKKNSANLPSDMQEAIRILDDPDAEPLFKAYLIYELFGYNNGNPSVAFDSLRLLPPMPEIAIIVSEVEAFTGLSSSQVKILYDAIQRMISAFKKPSNIDELSIRELDIAMALESLCSKHELTQDQLDEITKDVSNLQDARNKARVYYALSRNSRLSDDVKTHFKQLAIGTDHETSSTAVLGEGESRFFDQYPEFAITQLEEIKKLGNIFSNASERARFVELYNRDSVNFDKISLDDTDRHLRNAITVYIEFLCGKCPLEYAVNNSSIMAIRYGDLNRNKNTRLLYAIGISDDFNPQQKLFYFRAHESGLTLPLDQILPLARHFDGNEYWLNNLYRTSYSQLTDKLFVSLQGLSATMSTDEHQGVVELARKFLELPYTEQLAALKTVGFNADLIDIDTNIRKIADSQSPADCIALISKLERSLNISNGALDGMTPLRVLSDDQIIVPVRRVIVKDAGHYDPIENDFVNVVLNQELEGSHYAAFRAERLAYFKIKRININEQTYLRIMAEYALQRLLDIFKSVSLSYPDSDDVSVSEYLKKAGDVVIMGFEELLGLPGIEDDPLFQKMWGDAASYRITHLLGYEGNDSAHRMLYNKYPRVYMKINPLPADMTNYAALLRALRSGDFFAPGVVHAMSTVPDCFKQTSDMAIDVYEALLRESFHNTPIQYHQMVYLYFWYQWALANGQEVEVGRRIVILLSIASRTDMGAVSDLISDLNLKDTANIFQPVIIQFETASAIKLGSPYAASVSDFKIGNESARNPARAANILQANGLFPGYKPQLKTQPYGAMMLLRRLPPMEISPSPFVPVYSHIEAYAKPRGTHFLGMIQSFADLIKQPIKIDSSAVSQGSEPLATASGLVNLSLEGFRGDIRMAYIFNSGGKATFNNQSFPASYSSWGGVRAYLTPNNGDFYLKRGAPLATTMLRSVDNFYISPTQVLFPSGQTFLGEGSGISSRRNLIISSGTSLADTNKNVFDSFAARLPASIDFRMLKVEPFANDAFKRLDYIRYLAAQYFVFDANIDNDAVYQQLIVSGNAGLENEEGMRNLWGFMTNPESLPLGKIARGGYRELTLFILVLASRANLSVDAGKIARVAPDGDTYLTDYPVFKFKERHNNDVFLAVAEIPVAGDSLIMDERLAAIVDEINKTLRGNVKGRQVTTNDAKSYPAAISKNTVMRPHTSDLTTLDGSENLFTYKVYGTRKHPSFITISYSSDYSNEHALGDTFIQITQSPAEALPSTSTVTVQLTENGKKAYRGKMPPVSFPEARGIEYINNVAVFGIDEMSINWEAFLNNELVSEAIHRSLFETEVPRDMIVATHPKLEFIMSLRPANRYQEVLRLFREHYIYNVNPSQDLIHKQFSEGFTGNLQSYWEHIHNPTRMVRGKYPGACPEHSFVLVQMLRAVGLPALYGRGVLALSNGKTSGYHANAILLWTDETGSPRMLTVDQSSETDKPVPESMRENAMPMQADNLRMQIGNPIDWLKGAWQMVSAPVAYLQTAWDMARDLLDSAYHYYELYRGEEAIDPLELTISSEPVVLPNPDIILEALGGVTVPRNISPSALVACGHILADLTHEGILAINVLRDSKKAFLLSDLEEVIRKDIFRIPEDSFFDVQAMTNKWNDVDVKVQIAMVRTIALERVSPKSKKIVKALEDLQRQWSALTTDEQKIAFLQSHGALNVALPGMPAKMMWDYSRYSPQDFSMALDYLIGIFKQLETDKVPPIPE
ncbi:hypothetical protein K1X76_03745 [bacterium]|nr:hypothetical protein [bacterium]